MNRKDYLQEAEKTICNSRLDVHGSPEDCFGLIADYWSTFLTQSLGREVHLKSKEVGVMMTLFKTARWQINPSHKDNVIDALGYWALAGEIQDQDTFPRDDNE